MVALEPCSFQSCLGCALLMGRLGQPETEQDPLFLGLWPHLITDVGLNPEPLRSILALEQQYSEDSQPVLSAFASCPGNTVKISEPVF